MTVPSEQSSIQYDADGVSVSFPVPFRFIQDQHLRVTLLHADVETVLVLGADYSVSGANDPAGGSITTTVAYPPGDSLTIERIVPITQETHYQRNDPFPERAHEQALDKLTMISQQIASVFGMTPGSNQRALLAPFGESIGLLPRQSARANSALGFDANGDPVAIPSDLPEVVDALERAEAAAESAEEDAGIAEAAAASAAADAANAAIDAGRAEAAADAAEDAANTAIGANRTIFRETYAQLLAAMQGPPAEPDETPGQVTNDPSHTDENPVNGNYIWRGGVLVRSAIQPVQKTDLDKKLDREIVPAEEVAFSVQDKSGLRHWIESNKADGGMTPWAEQHVRRRLGVYLDTVPGVLVAVVTPSRQMTDITLDARTGQFAEWVIKRMAPRIAAYLPPIPTPQADLVPDIPSSLQGSNITILASDRYVRGTEVLPVAPNMARWAGWGSSTMSRIGSYLASVASDFGATYHNGGQGGEWSNHVSARMGSIPALLTFPGDQIPASGSVTVTASNMAPNAGMKDYEGVISGVHGMLTSTASVLTFTRTEAGAAVSVEPDSMFIPDIGPQRAADVSFLNMGKNDLTTISPDIVSACIRRTDTSHDWLAPMIKRVLVWGHFCNTTWPAVSAAREQVYQVNAAHAKRYGDRFIDLHTFLTTPAIWDYTGITPTQDDLDAQAIGNKPPSVSLDSGHLNAAGYAAVAQLVRERILYLGWY